MSTAAAENHKVLYEKDGVPTYVETIRCASCDSYFTLTFTDPKNRSSLCSQCWRSKQESPLTSASKSTAIVPSTSEHRFSTTMGGVPGPESSTPPLTNTGTASSITPTIVPPESKYRYIGSNYTSTYKSPKVVLDEFFASLDELDIPTPEQDNEGVDEDVIEITEEDIIETLTDTTVEDLLRSKNQKKIENKKKNGSKKGGKRHRNHRHAY